MIENRFVVFVIECIIIQEGRQLNEEFLDDINDFFRIKYNDNKELFGYLFDDKWFSEKIANNNEIVSFEEVVRLISKYRGVVGYLDLVQSFEKNINSKINDLALKFNEYCTSMIDFYYINEKEPKIKLLQ